MKKVPEPHLAMPALQVSRVEGERRERTEKLDSPVSRVKGVRMVIGASLALAGHLVYLVLTVIGVNKELQAFPVLRVSRVKLAL